MINIWNIKWKYMTIENANASMGMLDVHVLISHDTTGEWVEQCLDSVYLAINKVPAGLVNLYIVNGSSPEIIGHIGKCRATAFSYGNAPYVTYVDDDDYVKENHFQLILEKLYENPDAVYFGENWQQNGFDDYKHDIKHHGVHKRDFIESLNLKMHQIDTSFYMRNTTAEKAHIIQIPECTYTYRIHPNSHYRKIKRNLNRALNNV